MELLRPAPRLTDREDAALRQDYIALFHAMCPGFFETPDIRALPEDLICEELLLNLREHAGKIYSIPLPRDVCFGYYRGDRKLLRRAVEKVNPSWVMHYTDDVPVYCGYKNGAIASFCTVVDRGYFPFRGNQVLVAAPGCVGTVPEYRRMGIGLAMIRDVTDDLTARGFDYSHIHYTAVAHWYAKLGYRSFARWTRNGILLEEPNDREWCHYQRILP